MQTVFLRNAADQAECERLLAGNHRAAQPVTNYVFQPPCSGAALAIEVWAIGGKDVRLERVDPKRLVVSYDSVRWVHCGGNPTCQTIRMASSPRRVSGLERHAGQPAARRQRF